MQKYFFIKTGNSYQKLLFSELVYVEGARNYLKLVTENRSFLILMTMRTLEQLLPADLFVRIHKSYIVSLDHINAFDRESVQLKNNTLPIGSQYKGAVEKRVLIAADEKPVESITLPINYLRVNAYTG